ncbi:hypothetical protein [Paenibacillus sp. OV219]|uniref:hypothetical protein n=1 Tax=Paenibacillus sp. OV219 TaxID=1884377 RepID=UPI0008B49A74|nr:hypothetical protein [Paenibacillus sp. OV219]SEM58649.1 hypothetical protein SAMN05518847_101233 [Paenibacillus sp. OV219]
MNTRINRHHPIALLLKLYQFARNLVIPISLFIINEIKGNTGSQSNFVYLIAAS